MCNPGDDETLEHWLTVIEEEGRDLSKWEEDFIESLREQWDRGRWMSERQREILERIYADQT